MSIPSLAVALVRSAACLVASSALVLGGTAFAADAPAKAEKTLRWLDPVVFAPDRVLPAPPPAGSVEQHAEMTELHDLWARASAARHAAAAQDGEQKNPDAFDAVVGRDLLHRPAMAHLLDLVDDEVEALADISKRHFHRARPYAVDPALPHCGHGEAGGKGSDRSYPSGHAAFAWSTAWVLAALMPERSAVIFARAADYGFSREICAVHFPSDVEAGHVLGVAAATALLADPRLAPAIAAARAELPAR